MIGTRAKPFLKWAGGKTQLLSTIDYYLPEEFSSEKEVTYIEPFVGGGAMLFYMLQKYPNITRTVINDINPHLIRTYRVIKEQPRDLIYSLRAVQSEYRSLPNYDSQKEFYLHIRSLFNSGRMTDIEEATYMMFMNRTCFNGLYRENSSGGFNVPFGKYANPLICDEPLILANSELLQQVEILNGDFSQVEDYVSGYTFVYFDPPYRPLSTTSSFNSYVKEPFDDKEQIRLKDFYASLANRGCRVMLSNSDGQGKTAEDNFMSELYVEFYIERVYAKRCINANPSKRGYLSELLIRNYYNCQGRSIDLVKAI